MQMRTRLALFAAISMFAQSSCTPTTSARDFGSAQVLVTDEAGTAVGGAPVQISALNSSGGTYYISTQTRADGKIEFGVPAGDHTVVVTPPVGFSMGPDPMTRTVTVAANQTTSVTIRLHRG